jgi:hypothetical protein
MNPNDAADGFTIVAIIRRLFRGRRRRHTKKDVTLLGRHTQASHLYRRHSLIGITPSRMTQLKCRHTLMSGTP